MTGEPPAAADPGAVTLECQAEQAGAVAHLEGMCAAMASALAEATSAPVTRGQGSDGGLHLSLYLLRGTPAYLVARLDWQAAGDQRPTQGEQQSVGAVDTVLNERSYDLFARNVLRASGLPLP